MNGNTLPAMPDTPLTTEGLQEGDLIQRSVTHLVKYKGHEWWEGTQICSKVQAGESGGEAIMRVDALVQEYSVRAAHSTARTIDANSQPTH
jgi:hypothetical protein